MELEEDSAQREGVVRLIIKDFSQLKDEKFSAPVYIRNLPWRLMCTQRKVKVHASQKKVKTLAAFLQCNFETESL
ncbi:ubiquitin carboxyl-terminal hydrolase 7-like [Paramuricea clavata]|uniref:Ubiquitin carboxyl-terminal hydrolase 7-like n=1 Tax=Paramuricea clavata TaxID=317549 RepID=A0A7D9JL45_PARCT|nr:ubiquitin carboxyl-terminal hydrolase 7-like [Paramuricea clavata]